jgi:hypothetical protein
MPALQPYLHRLTTARVPGRNAHGHTHTHTYTHTHTHTHTHLYLSIYIYIYICLRHASVAVSLQDIWWISEQDEAVSRSMQVPSVHGVLAGYSRGTHGYSRSMQVRSVQGYSRGTRGVLTGTRAACRCRPCMGYSRGTHGYSWGTRAACRFRAGHRGYSGRTLKYSGVVEAGTRRVLTHLAGVLAELCAKRQTDAGRRLDRPGMAFREVGPPPQCDYSLSSARVPRFPSAGSTDPAWPAGAPASTPMVPTRFPSAGSDDLDTHTHTQSHANTNTNEYTHSRAFTTRSTSAGSRGEGWRYSRGTRGVLEGVTTYAVQRLGERLARLPPVPAVGTRGRHGRRPALRPRGAGATVSTP